MPFDLPLNGASGSPPHKLTKLSSSPPPSHSTCPTSTSTSTSAPPPPPARKRLGVTSTTEKSQNAKKLTLKPKPRLSDSHPIASPSSSSSSTSQPTPTSTDPLLTLTRFIRCIQSRPPLPTPESVQTLYSLCESVVSLGSKSCEALYEKVRMEIERHAGEVRRLLGGGEGGEGWMEGMVAEWKRWDEEMLLVRSVLTALDRGWVIKSRDEGVLGIWDLGQDIFRHSIIEHESVSERLTTSFLSSILRERRGDSTPLPLLSSLLRSLSSLSATSYTTIFSQPFIASTRAFYAAEASQKSTELTSSLYLKMVEERLREEKKRCEEVIGNEELSGGVERVVLEECVEKGYVEAIVEKDLGTMMKDELKDDLKSLYHLLSLVGSLPFLRSSFLSCLKEQGLSLVMDPSLDSTMVPSLISLRQRSLSILDYSFAKDQTFQAAISTAFEHFINKRENRPAEMLAKWLDGMMRGVGGKGVAEEEMEERLKEVLGLFRFTQGKDIFEAFYKRDFAKRLLLNKSASFDAERSMLTKLKDECGPGFTQSLETMFKDIELSSDFNTLYSSSLHTKPSFDLTVSILSTGNWPSYPPTSSLRLPPTLTTQLDHFARFYISKHSGRTLNWVHSLSTLWLKAKFGKKTKELNVSLSQALCLLVFNEVQEGKLKVGFQEILDVTGIEKEDCRRTLQSLACGKVRVLRKEPKGREVEDGDKFAFNEDFKDDHVKIKINQIQQKETAEENKSTTDRVFTDRASHLQLAIVRIMKARKTLKYTELVMEVVAQIGSRFKVETGEIKKSISSLIDRDYLRRAEGAQNVFEYLA